MGKSIKVNQKKRGRPATGRDPVSAVRLPTDLTAEIDAWAEKHGSDTRSEAIRRLVELGLTVKAPARPAASLKAGPALAPAFPRPGPALKPGRRMRARELATTAIEKIIDPVAPPEERTERKRRLTKGPAEFRDARVDQPKAKGK
jgi:hypothetical protein